MKYDLLPTLKGNNSHKNVKKCIILEWCQNCKNCLLSRQTALCVVKFWDMKGVVHAVVVAGDVPRHFKKFSMTQFLTWPNQIKLFFNAIPVKVLYFVNDHKNFKSSGWQKKPKAWNK